MAPKVRPGIMDIAPYVGGEADIPGIARPVKLSSNENPLGPSPKAMAAFREAAVELHRYPDGGAERLREGISRRFGLAKESIVCGNGSDELIALLTRAYAGLGDEVLFSRHGFLMYRLSTLAVGATPRAAPEKNLATDMEALLAMVTPATRIVFLGNPNNPTGTLLPHSEFFEILKCCAGQGTYCVLDESFIEFTSEISFVREAIRQSRLIVVRSLTKFHALPGLRVGYLVGHRAVASRFSEQLEPWSVNTLALIAAARSLAPGGAAGCTCTGAYFGLTPLTASKTAACRIAAYRETT